VATISRLLKITVSFAEYSLFYRVLLQKRPIILRSLLIEATPYQKRPFKETSERDLAKRRVRETLQREVAKRLVLPPSCYSSLVFLLPLAWLKLPSLNVHENVQEAYGYMVRETS